MKLQHTILPALLFCSSFIYAQTQVAYNTSKSPVHKTERTAPATFTMSAPSFVGGNEALSIYLNENLQYPEIARKQMKEGTVELEYKVLANGSITNIKVVKSVSHEIDKEAIRLVKEMPIWIPAKQNNKPQQVKYKLPITFSLTF